MGLTLHYIEETAGRMISRALLSLCIRASSAKVACSYE
jgi:hypothetical protein